MEEHYISKLHPVVDYGAGVFLLLIGEFCLCSLGVLRASGWTGRGCPHPCSSQHGVLRGKLEGNDGKSVPTSSPA